MFRFHDQKLYAVLQERTRPEMILSALMVLGFGGSEAEIASQLSSVTDKASVSKDLSIGGSDNPIRLRVKVIVSRSMYRQPGELDVIFVVLDEPPMPTESAVISDGSEPSPTASAAASAGMARPGTYIEFLPVFQALNFELPEANYLDAEETQWHPGLVCNMSSEHTPKAFGYTADYASIDCLPGHFLGDLDVKEPNRTFWFSV